MHGGDDVVKNPDDTIGSSVDASRNKDRGSSFIPIIGLCLTDQQLFVARCPVVFLIKKKTKQKKPDQFTV